MKLRLSPCLGLLSLGLAVLLAASCASEVAVSPQGSTIVDYSYWGTMSGNVKGDVQTVFMASIRGLDDLKYYRPGEIKNQDKGGPLKSATVYGRGPQDVLVTVNIAPAAADGMVELDVGLSPNNLPKTQAIFAAIIRELGNPQPGTPAPAGTVPTN
jgi:hypothetical protein